MRPERQLRPPDHSLGANDRRGEIGLAGQPNPELSGILSRQDFDLWPETGFPPIGGGSGEAELEDPISRKHTIRKGMLNKLAWWALDEGSIAIEMAYSARLRLLQDKNLSPDERRVLEEFIEEDEIRLAIFNKIAALLLEEKKKYE